MDFLKIFQVIVPSSLVGSIIVVMILIIKGIFRDKLNSSFSYYLWIILLIKLIVPVGPETPLNITSIYNDFHIQSTIKETSPIDPEIISSSQPVSVNTGGLISLNNSQSLNNKLDISDTRLFLKNQFDFVKVFCLLWMSGGILLIARLTLGHKKLRKIVDASTKSVSVTHKEILYKSMEAMNIKSKVELLYSPKISSPSLCGLIKPKILIPTNVAENVSHEEFKYIIIHELTHLKNKDIIINYVITLLSIIYWFNPMLLYGFHKMRQDCEFSCDYAAISYLDNEENVQYGNAMIRILQLAGSSNRLMGTTSMVMNSFEIKRRIIMISKYKRLNTKSILLGIIIVVIIGGLAIGLNTSTSQAKTPTSVAEEFGRNLHSADAEKVAEYRKMLKEMDAYFPSVEPTKVNEDSETPEFLKTMESLDKNIQVISTETLYEAVRANRYNTFSVSICATGNYTVQITNFILDKNLYGEKEDKAGYYYEAKLKFISTDGKEQREDMIKGYIGLLKEKGKWKVSIYKLMEGPKLYLEQMTQRTL